MYWRCIDFNLGPWFWGSLNNLGNHIGSLVDLLAGGFDESRYQAPATEEQGVPSLADSEKWRQTWPCNVIMNCLAGWNTFQLFNLTIWLTTCARAIFCQKLGEKTPSVCRSSWLIPSSSEQTRMSWEPRPVRVSEVQPGPKSKISPK